MEAAQFCF
jgi:hypothetical protein